MKKGKIAVSIKEYEDKDFPLVKKLLKDCGIYDSKLDRRETLAKKIIHEAGSILLALIGGKLVGIVYTIFDPWKSFVYHLGVRVDYQGNGIGSVLLAAAEKRLFSMGAGQVLLFVKPENTGKVAFYERKGWGPGKGRILMEKNRS